MRKLFILAALALLVSVVGLPRLTELAGEAFRLGMRIAIQSLNGGSPPQ